MCLTAIFLATTFFLVLNKVILSLWVRLRAQVLNFQAKKIGYVKNKKKQLKWDNWIILQKTSSMERNVENWPHALLIERRPQIAPTNVIDFGSTPASAQIGCVVIVPRNLKAQYSCHAIHKGAVVPKSSIWKSILLFAINYNVLENEDNDPFLGARSKRKLLLQVFSTRYSLVQFPDFLPIYLFIYLFHFHCDYNIVIKIAIFTWFNQSTK